jgi:AcrR family transcriptional regulator
LEIDSNFVSTESIPTLDSSPVAPAPRGLKKTARTRLRLVEAVRAEIEHAGGFTAEQVARRAETSPATFYNHFPSKDEALAAGFAAVMDDLVAHVETHLHIERLLDAGLDRFAADWVLACVDFFRANSATLRAAQARMSASDELRRSFRAHEAAALALYVRFVELGQRARTVRAGDAEAIARALMIQNEGWNHPAVLKLTPGDPLHRELARGVVRHLESDAPHPQGAKA